MVKWLGPATWQVECRLFTATYSVLAADALAAPPGDVGPLSSPHVSDQWGGGDCPWL